MLFSELAGKVLVNLENGEVIGNVGDADLLIDELTGDIDALLLPARNHMLSRNNHDDAFLSIKWKDVKKIGPEIVVVELEPGRNTLW